MATSARSVQGLRYTRTAAALHWTVAALVIANLALGLALVRVDDATSLQLVTLHKPIGLTVLVLTLARVAWRIGHRPPPLPADVGRSQALLAHAVHWTLYALLLLVPLAGWGMVSSNVPNYPLSFFGLFIVPPLPLPGDKALSQWFLQAHNVMAFAMLGLVALHICAALKHQFVDRDSLIYRMLP